MHHHIHRRPRCIGGAHHTSPDFTHRKMNLPVTLCCSMNSVEYRFLISKLFLSFTYNVICTVSLALNWSITLSFSSFAVHVVPSNVLRQHQVMRVK
jgi:hypothetical protein